GSRQGCTRRSLGDVRTNPHHSARAFDRSLRNNGNDLTATERTVNRRYAIRLNNRKNRESSFSRLFEIKNGAITSQSLGHFVGTLNDTIIECSASKYELNGVLVQFLNGSGISLNTVTESGS